jgi:hypothetical protein
MGLLSRWKEYRKIRPMDDELPTPLDFLKAVYCNEGLPLGTRLRAAMAAAPFCHPKLGVTMQVTPSNDLAERLMQAIAASQQVREAQRMKVIEAPRVEPSQIHEPLDHSGPFTVDNKTRFRRI